MTDAPVSYPFRIRDAGKGLRVPEVKVGDYVIIHVGFAISQVDEEEALKTLELLRMIDEEGMAMELGAMAEEAPVGAVAPVAAEAPPPGAPV